MKRLKRFLFSIIFLGIAAEAGEYTFGQGWQPEETLPVVVGGYFSTEYGASRESRYVDVDDLALMVYGGYRKFSFMSEFEASDLYRKETGAFADENGSGHFHIERLYGDYYIGEGQRLRIGKFNSDIGFWNQMPINVLRDTTSSPRLVEDFFPKLTTGVHYERNDLPGMPERVSLTLQNTDDLDSGYNNYHVERHYAAAADFGNGRELWRTAGGYFKDHNGREAGYVAVAYRYEETRWRVLAETVLFHERDTWFHDVYVQGVWKFLPRHYSVVRVENGQSPRHGQHTLSVLAGYGYRPLPNVALKAEYITYPDGVQPDTALFSVSVLF